MTVIREWFLYIPASPPPFFLPSSSLYKIVQMCLPVFFPSSILHRDLLLLLSLWMLLLTRVAFHFGSVPATVSMKIFANFIFLFFSFCCVLCVSHSVKWIALSLSFQKLYRHGHIIPSIEQHSSSIAPRVICVDPFSCGIHYVYSGRAISRPACV